MCNKITFHKGLDIMHKKRAHQKCQSNCSWHIAYAIFIYSIFISVDLTASLLRGNLLIPQTYSPINGDLNVQLQYFSQNEPNTNDTRTVPTPVTDNVDDYVKTTTAPKKPVTDNTDDVRLHISRYTGTNRSTVAFIDVYPDARLNTTQITISCLNFLFGGTYELEIVGGNAIDDASAANSHGHDERLRQQLDVRWPQPKLSVTPETIDTYPEQAVDVILEFPGVECIVPSSLIDVVPEFRLELYYCGHEVYCDSTNVSSTQILYSEPVHGFPKAHLVKLSCELFGLAGHYVVKLRPNAPVSQTVTATAYIKADWSEQYVFNVHARSISPCDPHTGIGVLFEYPACILDRADRIRLFGKMRADVASLAPPTSLHYITEQRVARGQHALHFDCDYFSERYVEYCFVYVSQAISGAVADVRMDCLPTLPVRESERGGWGEWSEWTPCSTTCAGGTRNRYRVCDSPPPRYGALFCEGAAVEAEDCGGSISDSWECFYGAAGSMAPSDFAEKPGVKADIGSDCRCGCIVHLTVSRSRRIIAASAQSCPGRTFWLIQADAGHRVRIHFDFFRLICAEQYIRVRDGDSLASDLIGEFVGGNAKASDAIVSTESKLLLEFYSNELSTVGESCKGGFLTHVQQIQSVHGNGTNVIAPRTSKAIMPNIITPAVTRRITIVHIIAMLFSSVIIVVSAMLGAQYMCRYRKYQLAESAGVEDDSPAHTPRASMGSIAVGQLPSRAVSTSTLISEVVSFVKTRPRGRWMKHSRLRESVDGEALENALQNQKSPSDDTASLESTHTLTNETINGSNDACEPNNVITTQKLRKNNEQDTASNRGNSNETISPRTSTSPSLSYGSNDNDSKDDDDGNINGKVTIHFRRHNLSSTGNSVTPKSTPLSTPMPIRRSAVNRRRSLASNRQNKQAADKSNKSSGSDEIAVDTSKSDGAKKSARKKRTPTGCNSNQISEDNISTSSSFIRLASGPNRSDIMRMLSVSNATLRNSCNSPVSSIVSVSTNPSINIKESKEKRNRQRLMAGPGSEFSLANPEDLEMDYYDYNVINAANAPGSYLGMDPAYLVWIPPLSDGIAECDSDEYDGSENDSENTDEEPHYDEISPAYERTANTSSFGGGSEGDYSDPYYPKVVSAKNVALREQNKILIASTINANGDGMNAANVGKSSTPSTVTGDTVHGSRKTTPLDIIQMTEFRSPKSKRIYRQHDAVAAKTQRSYQYGAEQRHSYASTDKDNGTEKETAVIKSPNKHFREYYELDDIQFADDDDDEDIDSMASSQSDLHLGTQV